MFDIRKIQEQAIFTAVKAASNDEVAKEVVFGKNNPATVENNPTWVKNTMERIEAHFDASSVKKIRMSCQCGYGITDRINLVKELLAKSSNMEEFAHLNEAKAAGLSYSNGKLFLQFPFCPCPMLADVDKLETNTWCQCTTGYSKVLFEKAFGCEVDVELLKSVKMGDDICLMEIIPLGSIWK